MKRSFGLIVLIVGVVVAAIALVRSQSSRADEAERELAWTRLQKDFAERAPFVRAVPDAKAYSQESRALFAWYFKQVDEFNARHENARRFDAYLEELEQRGAKDQKARVAAYEFVKKNFDALRGGQFEPVYTAEDKGLRFDLVSAEVIPVGTKRQIRWNLILWGAQRSMGEDSKGARKMITSAQFRVAVKLLRKNPKDTPYEMTIDGDPAQKIDWPERFLAAFPSQAVLGHFDLDTVPNDVEKAEITFTVTSRANTGAEAVATFPWTIDVPDDWKLKPGESWEGATETEVAAEEP